MARHQDGHPPLGSRREFLTQPPGAKGPPAGGTGDDRRIPATPLAFLFTAPPGDQAAREATVELVHGTETVRRAGVPLPPPDADGLVRVVSGLAIDGVAPGAYVLRLRLDDGRAFETRTADVALAP